MLANEDIFSRLSMPKRLLALEQSGLMDSSVEEDFDRITRLVRGMIRCDICLVSLVDDRRQFFKSSSGLAENVVKLRQTPLTHSFCKHVVADDRPLVVDNAEADARVCDNLAVKDLKVIAYLGVPIHGPDGSAFGSLCVIDHAPRKWTAAEQAALQDFCSILESTIRVRAFADDAMAAARSNAVVAREYHHRVKNALAVSACLVRIAARSANSVSGLVSECNSRFASLGRAQDLVVVSDGNAELAHIVDSVLGPFGRGLGASAGGPPVALAAIQVTPLALALHELATNSAKYGALASGAAIDVRWSTSADQAIVTVAWIEATTPEPDASERGGFGTLLLDVAAQQLNGSVVRSFTEGALQVVLTFPIKTVEQPS
ncbi:MAG: GAF domain-containing protein [Proteobacteria bacterium]|nr:GAF domain-containing protein [Pseudomonadota bacterium]